MLGRFEKIFASIKHLSWERLLMVLVFVLILLAGYYGYRTIDSMDFSKGEKSDNAFIKQFGKDYVAIDANIHDILTSLKFETRADWVLFLGIHNGQNIGPYHLKKISVIDESVASGNAPLYSKIQNIPMNLYAESYPHFDNPDTVTVRYSTDSAINGMSELRRNGIRLEIASAIFIKRYDRPIGFVGIYYKQTKANNIMASKDSLEEYKNRVKRVKESIEYELNRAQVLDG